jgi:Leucine-rich repeat (LRR) protein
MVAARNVVAVATMSKSRVVVVHAIPSRGTLMPPNSNGTTLSSAPEERDDNPSRHGVLLGTATAGAPAPLFVPSTGTLYARNGGWNNLDESSMRDLVKDVISLDVSDNAFTSMPESISTFSNVKEIDASSNPGIEIPAWIGELHGLERLDLSSSSLVQVPDGLKSLENLTTLSIAQNSIYALPEWLERLGSLRRLDAAANRISSLPESIGGLRNLQEIDLRDNLLTDLPPALANLSPSLLLQLDGNPLRPNLGEVYGRGDTARLLEYLRSLKDSVVQYEAKVMIVGEGNVGVVSLRH